VLHRGGSTDIVYHCNIEAAGSMLITEVGDDFSRRNHLGVFHAPLPGAPDNGRCASASFASDRGSEYLVYEAGERLAGNLAIAREV